MPCVPHPGRLSQLWTVPGLALRPSQTECKSLLLHLQRVYGEKSCLLLLGVPCLTFRGWRDGKTKFPASAVRAVWLIHALCLRPDRVQSLFDLATWGRFRVETKPKCQEPDWQI